MDYKSLFEPGQIGRMELKNRIVMAPMATGLPSDTGGVTQWLIDYYVERAKGGVGLIIGGATQVDWPRGTHGGLQLRIDDDRFIPGLSRLAEAVQRYGAKIVIELHHAGGFSLKELPEGVESVAPSAIVYGRLRQGEVVRPRELEIGEIEEIAEKFARAAERAKKAGFDAVEIHGGHHYLFAQFMSPLTNKRTDDYGGSLEKRMKFPMEVLARIKARVGDDYPIIFRMNGAEFVEGGLTIEDSKIIAPRLERAGVAALDITAGSPSKNFQSAVVSIEPMSYPEGWKVYLAEEIKKVVNIPVVTVGVIRDPRFADQILQQGRADFVALGRALLADPHWARKAVEGKEEHIRKCISCNECTGFRSRRDTFVRCAVNAAMGREEEFEIRPATVSKKVLVIGGGPAGMETARIASMRGHQVTLVEKAERLGGQLIIGSVAPLRDKYGWFRDYLVRQIEKLRVNVRLGKEATLQSVKEIAPDVVIIATGSEPIVANIPGADNKEMCLTAREILRRGEEIEGSKVVVVGGGLTGCETAMFLAEQGKQVVIVEMMPMEEVASDAEPITRFDLLERLRAQRVEIRPELKVLEIKQKGILVEDRQGERALIAADKVVLSIGVVPNSSLARELKGKVAELHVIGDAHGGRNLTDAVYEGSWVGRLI